MRTIDDRQHQHRMSPAELTYAWIEYYLEKRIAVVLNPTRNTWLKEFIDSDMHSSQSLQTIAYHLFNDALHPTTHPCFHHRGTLTATPRELKITYEVPY